MSCNIQSDIHFDKKARARLPVVDVDGTVVQYRYIEYAHKQTHNVSASGVWSEYTVKPVTCTVLMILPQQRRTQQDSNSRNATAGITPRGI